MERLLKWPHYTHHHRRRRRRRRRLLFIIIITLLFFEAEHFPISNLDIEEIPV